MGGQENSDLEIVGLRFQVGIFEEALAVKPDDTEALRFLAHGYTVLGRAEEGLDADRRLAKLLPRDPRVRYNLACSCALTGRTDEAIEALTKAMDLGFSDLKLVKRDRDLEAIRTDPRFIALVARLES